MTPTFTTAEVAAAARITYRRVDYYLRIGTAKANEPLPGSGHRRTFEAADAVHIATIAELVRAGFKAATAADMAASGADQFEVGQVQVEVDLTNIRSRTLEALNAAADRR